VGKRLGSICLGGGSVVGGKLGCGTSTVNFNRELVVLRSQKACLGSRKLQGEMPRLVKVPREGSSMLKSSSALRHWGAVASLKTTALAW
jgi:hypothetical protein